MNEENDVVVVTFEQLARVIEILNIDPTSDLQIFVNGNSIQIDYE